MSRTSRPRSFVPDAGYFAGALALVILVATSTASAKPVAAAKPVDSENAVGDQLQKDLEAYWGKKRAIRVVVKRRYRKRRRFELDVFVGLLPNDHFLVYLSPGLRMAYHFSELLALEWGGAYSHGFDTTLKTQLERDDALVQATIRDDVMARFGGGLLITPIYGKFAAGGTKLAHFDIFFAVELGAVYTRRLPELGLGGKVSPEVGVGVGMRFYLSQLLSLRVEFRQRVAFRESGDERLFRAAFPSEISLGLAFLLGKSPERKR